jgi:glycerol-3-phosphate dehydrogenase
MGLLDPSTSDGRVIFFLPWQGNTIAGTTDSPAPVQVEPKAQEEEIRWVLEEIRRYLSPDIKVRRGDVLSAWSGLRPLVRNPNASNTEGLVRNHMIHVGLSGMVTIAGGKWTTYRAMAQETVDVAVKVFRLEGKVKNGCITDSLRLVGSDGWNRNMFIGLIQRVCFSVSNAFCVLTVCCSMGWLLTLLSTFRTATVIVLGPSAHLRSQQEIPGRCTVSV